MSFFARLRGPLSLCLFLPALAGLAGCTRLTNISPLGGEISASLPNDETGLRRLAEELGRRYDANPADRQTVLTYATVLRKLGQTAQAVAVLQREAARTPDDLDVLGAYGKTNMIALDSRGEALAEVMLVVRNTEYGLVVQRGLERETWSCNPRCEAIVSPGDSGRHTGEAIGQAGQYNGFARPNSAGSK